MLRIKAFESPLLVAYIVNRCVASGFTCQKPVDGTVPTPGRMVTVGLSPVTCQRSVAVEPRSMDGAELVNETMTGGATLTAGFSTGGATLTAGFTAGGG
jgi:hypothetical protein